MGHPHWNIFEWDHADRKNGNVQHLRDHGIEPHEAEECFFHEFFYSKDDRRSDNVYTIDGRTHRGRELAIVFQDKGNGVVRVFTGWDLSGLARKVVTHALLCATSAFSVPLWLKIT